MGWGKLLNWFKRGEKKPKKSVIERSAARPSAEDFANLSANIVPEKNWDALHVARPLTPADKEYWTRLNAEIQAAEMRAAEMKADEEKERRRRSEDNEDASARSSASLPEGRREPSQPVDRWLSEGYFKIVDASSNVYAIKYDVQSANLYVQFQHWDPSMGYDELSGEPGPIYEYGGVSLAEARAFYLAASKGEWVWDNLRVRGTFSGHQKPYKLVAISQGYLPRKATWNYKNTGQEWFVQRKMWTKDGGAIVSQLPTAPARGFPGGVKPFRARPDNGRPDNGRPRG